MAAIDGVVLQFAATGDIATSRADLTAFGQVLATAAEPERAGRGNRHRGQK